MTSCLVRTGAKSVEESEEYKNLHARVKQLQEENKKERRIPRKPLNKRTMSMAYT